MRNGHWFLLGMAAATLTARALDSHDRPTTPTRRTASRLPASRFGPTTASWRSSSSAPIRTIARSAPAASAVLWSQLGHAVKLVSMTNGDIGHWGMAGGPLALRRNAEVQAAAKILGATTEVLDIHDGELMPTLENRKIITRLIRQWNADIVIAHRPNDYHPDHRYTGVLMQDSAYMVAVPFLCPDTPSLKKNPVFLYSSDNFKTPNPFRPDIVVAIDAVIEQKVDALAAMPSQFIEGGATGNEGSVPPNDAERKAAYEQLPRGLQAALRAASPTTAATS